MKLWHKLAIISSIGLVLTIFGLTIGILWSMIYSTILTGQLTLTPTSTNHDLWKETPIPMFLKLYFFNLTNPQAFTSPDGTKPNFVEMGPYVYREVDTKEDQVWNSNGTITYKRKRTWTFDESLSKGNLSDYVTNLNPITASVAYALKGKSAILRDIVDRMMESMGQKLVITKTVNELIFEGFDDQMLRIARKINFTEIPWDKFSWFYDRNGNKDYDGTFTMLTGKNSLLELGELTKWTPQDRKLVPYPGECGKVKGTNGDLWPPLPDNKTITFFVSDICTYMSLTYDNITVHKGLSGLRYISDDVMLDNGQKVPWRKCYCATPDHCIPSGVLDISRCKWNAPAFISMPHFYLADPSYRERVTGMKPDKEKHEIRIAIEPKTGVPLNVKAQLQLNLLIQSDDKMKMFRNITSTYVPMLWFTQEAYLTDDYASTIKFILILQSFGSITCYGIAAIGILILSITLFLIVRNNLKEEERQNLLSKNDNVDIADTSG
ncbi:protein croquemort-like isoform X2 [Ceratina calcarata]|nr:protein croquemort-like isoform X2 [Ceratina calcarata]XP_026668317.1 protein croquemort-like isoform X2 [Ceratina calcarata]